MKYLKLIIISILLPFCATAQTQTVTGNVYDEASKAPIPGVIIVLLNTNPQKAVASDENGRFHIDSVPIGRHSFKVSYLSYENKVLNDIEVTAGKEVNLNIGMQEAVHFLNEVNVVYDRSKDKNHTLNDMALVSARSFNTDETNRYAGSLNDPSRMVANFAGIVAGNDSRNDIVVRGNSPTGMLWQIDGLNSPNPNHFGALNSTGGPVSMINNNNIDKSDFFTGAFPAQYGNALAGVFDLRLREGNFDKAEYVAQVGFNGFEGGAEGPLGANKNTSYLFNYRYSTLGVFKYLGLNLGTGTSVPIYQDVNYKIVSKLSKKIKLSLFGIAGSSNVNFLGKDVDTTKPDLYSGNDPFSNMYTKYSSTITGVSLDHQVSGKTSEKIVAGFCTTSERYNVDSISNINGAVFPAQAAGFSTNKLSVAWSLMHKFSAKDNIKVGLSYDNTSFNLSNKDMTPGLPDKNYVNQTGSMGSTQAYAEWKHRFSKDLLFSGGLHAQYLDLNGSKAIEPRAGLRYSINSRNAISLGYGLHGQQQSIYSYFVQTPTPSGILLTNKNLGFTRSNQVIASYDLNINSNTRIKTEIYYQYLDKVPVTSYLSSYSAINYGISFAPPNQDNLVNNGTGYNKGAEITLEHFLTKGFYYLVTASLIDSKYKGSDGIERNTAFNTGYVLNMLAGKEFSIGKKGNILVINLKFVTIGGRYLTPLDLSASKIAGTAVYEDNLAFSEQQSPYFRTDFRVSYKKEYKKSTMEFALDLENVTNHKNIFDETFDKRTNQKVVNYQQGFFPVPLFRFTF